MIEWVDDVNGCSCCEHCCMDSYFENIEADPKLKAKADWPWLSGIWTLSYSEINAVIMTKWPLMTLFFFFCEWWPCESINHQAAGIVCISFRNEFELLATWKRIQLFFLIFVLGKIQYKCGHGTLSSTVEVSRSKRRCQSSSIGIQPVLHSHSKVLTVLSSSRKYFWH